MDLIEIIFYKIFTNDDDYMLIFREKTGKTRFLPMVIGISEAGNILSASEKNNSERPFLSDIFYRFLRDNSCSIERMVIKSLKQGIFYSEIHVKNPLGILYKYPVRPSDGLAMALRSDCHIFAAEEVFEEIEVNPAIQSTLESMEINQGIIKGKNSPPLQLIGQDFSLRDLSAELEIALSEENYEKAALIRDRIIEYKKQNVRD